MQAPTRVVGRHALRLAPPAAGTVFVWLATIIWPTPPSAQLDPSWQQVLADAWLHSRRFGHDIAFTWGPLGWWFSPHVVPGVVESRLLFEVTGRVLVAAVLVGLGWSLPAAGRAIWILAVLVFGLGMFDSFMLAAVVGIALLWMAPAGPRWRVGAAIVALGGLALVKFTTLVLVFTAAAVAALVSWLEGRRRQAAIVAAGVPAAVVGWWLLAAGQRLGDLGAYLVVGADLAAGYASAMVIEETRPVFWAGLGVLGGQAAWIGVAMWRARREAAVLARLALMALAVFLAWKHGYTRADAHVLLFYVSALLLSTVATALPPPARLPQVVAAGLALVSIIAIESTYAGVARQWIASVAPRVGANLRTLSRLGEVKAGFPSTPDAYPLASRLPAVRGRVGEGTVDLLGHEQGLLYANSLRHQPRPVFQSYSAYTGRLAELNRSFLHTAGAPDFMLAALKAIDGRYPAQDDAGVLRDLPFTYEPLLEERGFLLMRRLPHESVVAVSTTDVLLRAEVRPGEVIELPGGRDYPMWLTIESQPTLRARLRGVVYREPLLRLTTTDDQGRASEWRVVPRLAAYGFLVQPRLVDHADFLAWAHRSGQRWNTSLAVGTGAGDAEAWERFTVTVRRLSTPISRIAPADMLVAQGVTSTPPLAIDSPHPWRVLYDELGARLFVHAPGSIELTAPRGATRVRADFGLEPGSYSGQGATDGVTLVVDAIDDTGAATPIWRRALDPVTRPADRGRQTLEAALPEIALRSVRFRFESGPNASWDWSYLAGVRVE